MCASVVTCQSVNFKVNIPVVGGSFSISQLPSQPCRDVSLYTPRGTLPAVQTNRDTEISLVSPLVSGKQLPPYHSVIQNMIAAMGHFCKVEM